MAGFLPCSLQIGQRKHGIADFEVAAADFRLPDLVQDFGEFVLFEQGLHIMQIFMADLDDRTQLFVEQDVLVAAVFHQPFHGEIFFQINVQPCAAGKRHFCQRGKQAAVRTVVVGQQFFFRHQLLHDFVEHFERVRVDIGAFAAQIVPHLRQCRAAHARFAEAQIHQQQHAVRHGFDVGRNGFAHVLHGGEGGNNHGKRRHDGFLRAVFLPHGFHRQAVFAHGDAHAERLTQLRHGIHGAVEFFVFALHAAGGHPVGGEFDVAQCADMG